MRKVINNELMINVSLLPEEGVKVKGEKDPLFFADLKELSDNQGGLIQSFDSPIRYDFVLSKVNGEIFVSGKISLDLTLGCGRCLKGFPWAIDSKLQITYQPKISGQNAEEEIALNKDEIEVYEYENNLVDLGFCIKDQVLLSLPIKPLCREDCSGLCPKCGQDLNEKSCNCTEENFDSRLSALKTLKNKL